MNNHETVITSAFVDILRPMRATWNVYEEIQPYRSSRLRPDVFITEEGRKPIPIEIKIDDDDEGEAQAKTHLGQLFGETYDAALAEDVSQLKLFADEDAVYQAQTPVAIRRSQPTEEDEDAVYQAQTPVGEASVPAPAAVRGGQKP